MVAVESKLEPSGTKTRIVMRQFATSGTALDWVSEDSSPNAHGEWLGLEAASDAQETTSHVREVFRHLMEQWLRDTGHHSMVPQVLAHPSYGRILAMGSSALPIVFEELQQRPDMRLFLLLRALLGFSAVSAEAKGDIEGMAHAWLDWWRTRSGSR